MKFKIGDKVRLRYDKGYTKEACKEVWTVDEINPTFITVMSTKASMDKDESEFEYAKTTTMTKEEAYCKEQGITPYDEYDDNTIKQAYSDGYDAAEQSSDETMVAFAKWYYKLMTESNLIHNPKPIESLLTIFKETQNKEACTKQK